MIHRERRHLLIGDGRNRSRYKVVCQAETDGQGGEDSPEVEMDAADWLGLLGLFGFHTETYEWPGGGR